MRKAGIVRDGDGDQNLDIDVALSHIVKRIQSILEPFQKEFEGGYSAESLGPRYGMYGSFLPTYQRSPSVVPNSRNKLKDVNVATRSPPMNLSKVSSVDTSVQFWSSENHVSQYKPADLPMLQTDRKPLKVRIKLGSESQVAQKNAAIYSGLGLMSPSSPTDGIIPTEHGGKLSAIQETPCKSPSTIVEIMSSFPVPHGQLLTPLHDCFLRFVGDKNLLLECKSEPVQERSNSWNNANASVRECKEELGEMKMNLGCKNEILVERKNENNALPDKGMDGEKPKGLKFTMTCIRKNKSSVLAKESDERPKASVVITIDKSSSNVKKCKTSESVSSKGGSINDSLMEKVKKTKRASHDGLRKADKYDKCSDLARVDCDEFKGIKDRDNGAINPLGSKCDRNLASYSEDESKVPCLKELTIKGDENKSKRKLISGSLPKQSMSDDYPIIQSKQTITYESCISSTNDDADKESRKGKNSDSVLNGNDKQEHKSDVPADFTQVIKENWVCCDSCQKWRLLPYYSNPDLFPKKWKCRMIDWLPGMNKCSFSEEETTNALNALYVPIAEVKNNHQMHTEATAAEVPLAVSRAAVHNESFSLLNSGKKKEASVKSLNNENQLVSDTILGDAKPFKMKRMRESDKDEFVVTKEKTMHCSDQDQPPQNLKRIANIGAVVFAKKQNNHVAWTSSMDEHEDKNVLNTGTKRKMKDIEDGQIHTETHLCNERQPQENRVGRRMTSIYKHRKVMSASESKLHEGDQTRKVNKVTGRDERSFSDIHEQPRNEKTINKVEMNCVDKGLPRKIFPGEGGGKTKLKFDWVSASKTLSDTIGQENDKRSSEWCSKNESNNLETHYVTGDSQCTRVSRNEQGTMSLCSDDAPNNTKRFQTPDSSASRNTETSIPTKNNAFADAANKAFREANNLKNYADQLKVSGSGLENTVILFQAALKNFHGALLLQPGNSDTEKYGEMTLEKVYTNAAKLCDYCAHQYERCKDMASAALAYKCVEVAYMRLTYSNVLTASRDQHELQMAIQMNPSVESPSSSASDVDNANNQVGVSKPTLSGNLISDTRNQPSFVRLLNFTQHIYLAMEASRKSLDAYETAYANRTKGGNEESIALVKTVLDFSFHDLEGLLHLIRVAMEDLSR